MELIKTNGGTKSLTKNEFGDLLNKYVSKAVQPEEVDLIFPVLEEEREAQISMDQFHSLMHVFD
jgi:Ca2+-binding EF-hand superfamily protein